MTKLICIQTCYMPVKQGKELPVERFEDELGGDRDIYEVPDNRVDEFLATGHFKKA